MSKVRNLIVVFGDQLDARAAALEGFDKEQDAVWMAEAEEESRHVWSSKPRIAIFLAAMRHFRDELREKGMRVEYTELEAGKSSKRLPDLLGDYLRRAEPEMVIVTRPGEWRVMEGLEEACKQSGIDLQMREDSHFFTTPDDFAEHQRGRKSLRMEYFYREVRQRFGILMEGDEPAGGKWNFDKKNRQTFGTAGPVSPGKGPRHRNDTVTQAVIDLVNTRFADHPGTLDHFAWPVTRAEARRDLESFIDERLPHFGAYQDAMWTDQPWLYHAFLSSALNLKLLNPREVVAAAEDAYRRGLAPINAVEGFIRQILGWREYVRGIYWTYMPAYIERNAMGAQEPLPDFYWTGETSLTCLQQSIGQTLRHGYAHHIQRLMVTGLYAQLLGVHPGEVHRWYLAVYVDAVEWVELPNVLGMSQYADGGLMASKPYVATGKYIKRMSNYCAGCPKNPDKRTGPDACPFTTLYWDYLVRHQDQLRRNQRMALQVRNIDRLNNGERSAIARQANSIRENPACG